ncbi:predicted protein [Histoplasma mississippiense (nom. inval.)]|uniref:predicted protein n=1 Tax=Ajellomyces capsulatus (strain NAm1 / WU24) TaxID=2059318 RepID=UPI000157BC17|nr:predicted protein [Histoplasma mississippiense (nom. inval.)]EDN05524.1 predicted protein [Histoplasma mississippiense (nom. inval.)]
MTSLAECTEVEQQLQISKDLFSYGEKALALALQNRPKNTNKQYLPKQREWRDFCKETGFEDGEMVTERKLVWFLEEKVLCRPLQGSVYKSKRARTDRDGNTVLQTVGKSTVKLYVAAVVDLYRFQKSRGINSSDHPRGQLVSAVLRTHETKESVRKRAQYVDRGANTLQDGYNEKLMIHLMKFCWTGWYKNDQTSVISHLRTGLNFLMNHNMLLRGETSRTAQLPDLFTLQLSNEGPTPCWPMILITDNGKTNQLGRLEYAAVMRHKNPLLCTISHLAFYLFYRWNIVRESLPDFRRRSLCSYEQWQGLNHRLRATTFFLEPPSPPRKQLEAAIWPWVDVWLDRFDSYERLSQKQRQTQRREREAAEMEEVKETEQELPEDEQDLAAQGFLRLLKQLRTVILQDSVLLQRQFPDHPLWSDALFVREDYQKYTLQIVQALETAVEPQEIQIQRVVPVIADQLKNVRQEMIQSIDKWGYENQQLQQKMAQQLADLVDGQITFSIRAVPQSSAAQNSVMNLAAIPSASSLPSSSSTLSRDIVQRSVESEMEMRQSSSNNAESVDLTATLLTSSRTGNGYSLSRTIQSVPDLWREWTTGLRGGPSVQSLEDQGGSWRKGSSKEQMMFCRRKIIINEIRTRVSSGMAIDDDDKSSELHLLLCTHSSLYNNILFSSLSSSSFLLSTHHHINHSTIQGSPGSPRARCTLCTRQHDRAAGSKPPAIVHQCHSHSISRPDGATCMPCLPECSSRSSAECRRLPGHFGGACGNCKWRDHAIRCSERDGEGVEVIEIVDDDDDEEDGPQRRMRGPSGQQLLTAGSTPAAPIILD